MRETVHRKREPERQRVNMFGLKAILSYAVCVVWPTSAYGIVRYQ